MTTFLPKSAWRYGLQTVVLFALAAGSSAWVIAHLGEQFILPQQEDVMWQMNVAIWSLVMGFMFLAGALGLWAIRSTATVEGRRRIGRFVDDMDYLSDGLLALDGNGGIIGSNPAGKRLLRDMGSGGQQPDIYEAFSGLTRRDGESLLSSGQPCEIYVDCVCPAGLRSLRFRSQPSDGVILLLVSDVTQSRFLERRRRQISQLQLVGRIAGGVANDFNDILCAISGYLALLRRPSLDPAARNDFLDTISRETSRGALLSRMLLDLSRSGDSENNSRHLADDVKEAVSLLKVALPQEWEIRSVISGEYPTVPLAPSQIQQMILNLGLFAADAQRHPGSIIVTLGQPGSDHLMEVGNQFVAVVLISAHGAKDGEDVPTDRGYQDADVAFSVPDDSSVILSVVRAMVEEAGGRVDIMSVPGGASVYRVCLPHMDMPDGVTEHGMALPSAELNVYVSRWRVILGQYGRDLVALAQGLRNIGARVDVADDIGSLLTALEAGEDPDVIVIMKQVLGSGAESVLRALIKLAPHAGIVVLCEKPEEEPAGLRSSVLYVRTGWSPQDMLRCMVEAKTMARSRISGCSTSFKENRAQASSSKTHTTPR